MKMLLQSLQQRQLDKVDLSLCIDQHACIGSSVALDQSQLSCRHDARPAKGTGTLSDQHTGHERRHSAETGLHG